MIDYVAYTDSKLHIFGFQTVFLKHSLCDLQINTKHEMA